MTLRVKKLSTTAQLPTRGSDRSAGYDLAACLTDHNGRDRGKFTFHGAIVIMPGARALVPTGLAFTAPEGTYGRIAPRSGIALNNGIDTLAGVVDEDFTNEAGVVLVNLGQERFVIEHGMRIAQLILEKIKTPEVVEVDHLDSTIRGSGGFGSTGT